MKTSSYLEQTLFFEQSPTTDQYFEDRSDQLFELPGGTSFVKVHVQWPDHDHAPNGLLWDRKLNDDFKPLFSPTSDPPSPVDWHRYAREEPPHYVEPPRLRREEVSDLGNLTEIARVSLAVPAMEPDSDMIWTSSYLRTASACGS